MRSSPCFSPPERGVKKLSSHGGCENIPVQTLTILTFLSHVARLEAPLSVKSRQGAIERGRGESEGLGAIKEPEILTYLGMISLEVNFLTAPAGGDRASSVQQLLRGGFDWAEVL